MSACQGLSPSAADKKWKADIVDPSLRKEKKTMASTGEKAARCRPTVRLTLLVQARMPL